MRHPSDASTAAPGRTNSRPSRSCLREPTAYAVCVALTIVVALGGGLTLGLPAILFSFALGGGLLLWRLAFFAVNF
jgi:hypothetical protein